MLLERLSEYSEESSTPVLSATEELRLLVEGSISFTVAGGAGGALGGVGAEDCGIDVGLGGEGPDG